MSGFCRDARIRSRLFWCSLVLASSRWNYRTLTQSSINSKPAATVDDGNHELPPPQANHGSGTAVMVRRSPSAVSTGFARASPMASPFGLAQNERELTDR